MELIRTLDSVPADGPQSPFIFFEATTEATKS